MNVRVLASSSEACSVQVDDGRTALLLDCGLVFLKIRKALGFRVSDLGGVLVTHSHQDHSRAARDLMAAGVDCYMTEATAQELRLSGHRLKKICPLEAFSIGSWRILPFVTPHDVPNVGYLLASEAGFKVLYLTDTPYCRYRFRGLTHLLVEANFSREIARRNVEAGLIQRFVYQRVYGTHMSLERLLDMLRANDLRDVREIWLLHLSDSNSDADAFRRAVMTVTGKPVYVAPRGEVWFS